MTTTLADQLRALPDEALGALLRLRPDLVVPVPTDIGALAARAQSRVSVARALDGLDRFTLQVLDAVRLARTADEGTTSVESVLALAAVPAQGVDAATARAALDRLRARFIVYGPESTLRLVDAVDEVCSPYPAGLGRPAADLDSRTAALVADPARLRRTVLAAPQPARAVLDRLAAGPPVGSPATGAAVGWLLDNGLLVTITDGAFSVDADAVELPREVGLLLRRDTGALGPLHPRPPVPVPAGREPKAVDSAGAGQAMEVIRHVEALAEALAAEPAPVLRSGGIGVRELRRLAKAAGLDDAPAALLIEVGYAAGLLGPADVPGAGGRAGGDSQILPTTGYDVWRVLPLSARWEQLARGWLGMPRQAGLVGQRDDRDRPIAVLSTEVGRGSAPAARRAALGVLADLAPGAAPTADEVLDLLAWEAPRRGRGRESAYRDALAEAAQLGVTGLGALTSFGRVLLAETAPDRTSTVEEDPLGVRSTVGSPADLPAVARALDGLLPAPVDHLLVQADLTVVVPGPPEPALAAELDAVAEPESAGGASVYRVTPASVRRALDAGYSADDLHALFDRRSRTPVPQALRYLVDDTARKHGGLRAGPAGSYLRSDDEALLTQALADRRLTVLALRRLAPTVLVTPHQAGRLLATLREAGYAPVPEDASGAAVLSRPKVRRAPLRTPDRGADPLAAPALTQPRVLGIVEQLRRGDAAARAARRAPATMRTAGGRNGERLTTVQAHTQALAVLQQAVRDRSQVWVGYVDAHGGTTSRLLRPVSIGGGYLRAEDDRTETLHTFALHRITAAVVEE
ncbi:helicase-associated domain-containing protein [Polymorphospora sp. NPDC051019]|uniref:helicase-associated domain-containing protein n=1 Tax=Polymorphospora sp. NPDC051019 TaxID=3155725 RepID=UPI00344980A6